MRKLVAVCVSAAVLCGLGLLCLSGDPPIRDVDPGIDALNWVTTELPNEVRIEERDGFRYITANGIPDHRPGMFPNRGNPNSIRPQSYRFRVTLHPEAAKSPTLLPRGPFGVALNGIPFEPGTAEFWQGDPRSGWNYEALSGRINLGLDASHAHVQPNGAYHYHGIPNGLIELLNDDISKMVLVGYAADGFPIYGPFGHADAKDSGSPLVKMKSSYRLKTGTRPSGPGGAYDGTFVEDWEYIPGHGDLDECNGRFGVTPESSEGTYHYVLTETFPFIPRMFRGTPDESFSRRPPGGGPPGGPGGRRPPPPRF